MLVLVRQISPVIEHSLSELCGLKQEFCSPYMYFELVFLQNFFVSECIQIRGNLRQDQNNLESLNQQIISTSLSYFSKRVPKFGSDAF